MSDTLNWRGWDVADVLECILRASPNAKRIRTFRPVLPPPYAERAEISDMERALVANALMYRESTGLPFWDSVFLASGQSEIIPRGIIHAAMYHNGSDRGEAFFDVSSLRADSLRRYAADAARGEIVVVSSRVEMLDETIRHIPMIDFHIPASGIAERIVDAIIATVWGKPGFILCSGRSYHFYGDGLVNEVEMNALLARFLMFSPVVDRAWVAHQLLERACALRISPKNGEENVPTVVIRVGRR